MRSFRSQLLETDWHYRGTTLTEIDRKNFYEFLESDETFPEIPEQYLLFPDPLYLNDQEARYVVLSGLMIFYELNGDDGTYIELDVVYQAAHYSGLSVDSTQFRTIVESMDPWDLISALRRRCSRPITDGFEFV
jgi:hypothetical protein